MIQNSDIKKVVIAVDMVEEAFVSLENEQYNVIKPKRGSNFTKFELLDLIEDADALLSFFTIKIDKEIIEKGAKLKIISNYGVGYDNIDVEFATSRGIVVTNTPDPVTIPTAELAIGLMIDCARKISFLDAELRRNRDYKWHILNNLGVTLVGKTLGIFGMGRIGCEVARRAIAFGMKVIYHNRNVADCNFDAEFVSMDELLRRSDFISINAPSTPETVKAFSKVQFQAMKSNAIVINTARGDIIDELELVDALKRGLIGGAALDVYEKGDGNISNELLSLESVVIVPHIGTQTFDTRIEMGEFASQNIIRLFNGQKPLSQVNIL